MDYRKQAAINSVGSIVLMFGQWLISVLIVRMSGYEDAGIFSLAMTVSNVFSFFANYGLRNYQVSDVAGRYTQGQYILTRLLTSVASVVGCGAYLLVAGGYSAVERWAILLYLLYSNVNVISDTLLGSLQLHDRLYINGYSNTMRGAVCFAAFVGSYLGGHNLLVSLGIMALATLLLTAAYDWRCFCRVETVQRWNAQDRRAAFSLLKVCFALMLSNIFPVITTLVPAIIIALVPKMAKAWNEKNRRELLSLVGQTYGFTIAFVLLAELAALVAGRFVMQLIFGPEILQYYGLLYWAILATGINALTSCGNGLLIAVGSNRTVALGAAAALAATACLSDVLVRQQGIAGAAYVLTAAYLLQVLVQLGVLGQRIMRMK